MVDAAVDGIPNAELDKLVDEAMDEAVKKSTEYYNKNNAKPGSLASKANMVKQYNEKNNKNAKSYKK